MATVGLYSEFEHKGLDTASSRVKRQPGYLESVSNLESTLDNCIIKRPGYKAVADSVGGQGLFAYERADDGTQELLTLSGGTLYRVSPTTFTITYSGASTVTCSFYYDSGDDQYTFRLVVNGSTVLDYNLDLGIDGQDSVTLANLKTQVDAVSNFSSVISGTTTIPAAFLFPMQRTTSIAASGGTLTLTAYEWEAVNSTISGPMAAHWLLRNDSDYQLPTHVGVAGNVYIAAEDCELMKYDGQGFYRAGMPEAETPLLTSTAGAGASEVTVVACIADSSEAQAVQVELVHGTNSWSGGNRGSYFTIYDNDNDSVGVYFTTSAGPTDAPAGVDRTIKVQYNTSDSNATVAEAAKLAIDADADFTCTRTGSTITITNTSTANNLSAPAVSAENGGGTPLFDLTLLSAGVSGLNGKYFVLGGPSETVAFWYDVAGGTAEPNHGATRAVEITTVTAGMTAAQVATATELLIEADVFNSTVSSNEITVTASTSGARTDASAGTSGFGISITTQGNNGGLGAGDFIYHTTYEQVDHNGIVTEGLFSDDATITLTAGNDVILTLPTIEADSGFNTGCAIVNGAQANVNTITVDSGHTLETGDLAFFKGSAQNATKEVSTITTVGDTASSLDGKYFYLFGLNGSTVQAWAFWIDVDNNGTTEPSHGAPNSVEITGITAGMSANDVATAIGTAINATGIWTRSVVNNVITVTDVNYGARTNAYDGLAPTGFTFAVTTAGSSFRAAENVTRTVTATTSTSITVDGDPVTLADNAVISNGLKINIYRTETDGVSISKFLVDSVPNNSFAESVTYTDSIADDDLGRIWEEPRLDHGLPPRGKYIGAWNSVLVLGGLEDDLSSVAYSVAGETSPEYFPADTNRLLLTSGFGDKVKGLYGLSEYFLVFKDKSYFIFSGDIYADNVRVDQYLKDDFNFTSQHAVLDESNGIQYVDEVGVFEIRPGGEPQEISEIIKPSITGLADVALGRAISSGRRDKNQNFFFLPVDVEASDGSRYTSQSSPVFVYDTKEGYWWKWTNFNMANGLVKYGDDYFFQEERWDSVNSEVRYHLYRVNAEDTIYDYVDHDTAITGSLRTARYGADSPHTYKKYVRLAVQKENDKAAADETLTVTTHTGLTSTATDSSFTILPDTAGRATQRLIPTKSTAMAVTLSNANLYESMALVGWSIEGVALNGEHVKE